MDPIDRAIVAATQQGLPLCPAPYLEVARAVGVTEDEVCRRLSRMLEEGAIRRIGAVPNHYALGWRANGMTVWDVDDQLASQLGREVGALDFVSHCYLRPRRPGIWPYNLFAMVHGRTTAEVDEKVERIAELLGEACRGHDVLLSTRILKKSGLRLAAGGD